MKPEFRNVAIASAREKLVTSGTDDSVGPLETNNVTVEPGAISEFARRVHLDDDPLRVVRVDVAARDRETGALERPGRGLERRPDDRRHAAPASAPARR